MFTESSRYELYLTTMTFVLRDTPFALHTSSRILLETFVGSPGEQGAPLWMGLEYNLLEFVQTQADLSKFLEEFGQTEKSQVGRRSIAKFIQNPECIFFSYSTLSCLLETTYTSIMSVLFSAEYSDAELIPRLFCNQ